MKEASHKRLYAILIYLYEISRKGKYIETENRSMVSWNWGDGDVINWIMVMVHNCKIF